MQINMNNTTGVLGVASNSVHSMVSDQGGKGKQTLTKFNVAEPTHDVLSSAVGMNGSIGATGSVGDDYRKSLPNTVERDGENLVHTNQGSIDANRQPGGVRIASKNGRRLSSMGGKEGFLTTGSGYDSNQANEYVNNLAPLHKQQVAHDNNKKKSLNRNQSK